MLTSKEQSILAALEPRAKAEGIEVVTIEVVGSRKAPTIRVYLDKPEGIAFDDITAAQVWVNELMDEL
ncbi:MAG TPA: ribosome maturation factor RimP, partial [Slackia equolifaciens]|nr:ribosome maturation factor RimP [Slackia equolifaciens]